MVNVEQSRSEVPCVAPRGAQQKRGQNAMRRNRMAAKRRAVACSEPRCSLVRPLRRPSPYSSGEGSRNRKDVRHERLPPPG